MADRPQHLTIKTIFGSRDRISGLFSAPDPSPKEPNPKLHAACDECRNRKLKCSGQEKGCNRCVKHNIICHYSEQKPMGRPRKKQKTDDESNIQTVPRFGAQDTPQLTVSNNIAPGYMGFSTETEIRADLDHLDPSLAAVEQERTDFSNICNGPIAQTVRDTVGPDTFRQQVSHFQGLGMQQQNTVDAGFQPPPYPLDITQWPDYSTLESLPVPLQSDSSSKLSLNSYTASLGGSSMTSRDPDVDRAALAALPISPQCSCLASLYLALSTLSTLSSFPVSEHTVETLLAAHRTAHSVIYCPICPQKFQTGSQNLMLGCTLLNVLADHWHRVRKTSVEDIKKGFSTSRRSSTDISNGYNSNNRPFISTREGNSWRQFVHNLIRAYVFGDHPVPLPPSSHNPPGSNTNPRSTSHLANKTIPTQNTLVFIIRALQRRQRQWHDLDDSTDEFPDRCSEGYSYLNHNHHNHNHGHGHAHVHPQHAEDHDSESGPGFCRVHNTIHQTADVPEATSKGSKANKLANGSASSDDVRDTAKKAKGDHVLCLTLVKYSLDIVRSLDENPESSLSSRSASMSNIIPITAGS